MKKVRSFNILKVMIFLSMNSLLGCQKVDKKSCVLDIDEFSITYHIKHQNDIVRKVTIETKIGKSAFDYDEELIGSYLSGCPEYQILTDDIVIYEDVVVDDDRYSLKKTIDHLQNEGYKCY